MRHFDIVIFPPPPKKKSETASIIHNSYETTSRGAVCAINFTFDYNSEGVAPECFEHQIILMSNWCLQQSAGAARIMLNGGSTSTPFRQEIVFHRYFRFGFLLRRAFEELHCCGPRASTALIDN